MKAMPSPAGKSHAVGLESIEQSQKKVAESDTVNESLEMVVCQVDYHFECD